jgi:hypothetical protein
MRDRRRWERRAAVSAGPACACPCGVENWGNPRNRSRWIHLFRLRIGAVTDCVDPRRVVVDPPFSECFRPFRHYVDPPIYLALRFAPGFASAHFSGVCRIFLSSFSHLSLIFLSSFSHLPGTWMLPIHMPPNDVAPISFSCLSSVAIARCDGSEIDIVRIDEFEWVAYSFLDACAVQPGMTIALSLSPSAHTRS